MTNVTNDPVLRILLFMALFGALSFSLVWGLRIWAERQRIYDIPNERSSHTRPTPRGGGIAIVFVTLFGVWILSPGPVSSRFFYTIAALLIAIISLFDDLRSLSNRVRFVVHILAAVLAILIFGYFDILKVPSLGDFKLSAIGMFITFFWIVGLTNAYNFMDGIDGIAGGQAVVAGVGWAILGSIWQLPLVSVLGLLLAASSLGFLGHNWPPARIFMGDVGSAFLGYNFAVLAVIAAQTNSLAPLVGFLLVWPFVVDTGYTFIRRLSKRENVFSAHRSHIYQRLVISGLSHKRVSSLYISLAALGLVTALAFVMGFDGWGWIGLAGIILASLWIWRLTILREKRLLFGQPAEKSMAVGQSS